ncbi:MAG: TetR/AcrR family transcriptional regulator [Gammaproteobacteria bacterium]|nr:TetR/AcrR family transcriptional regulator [Gammaproteobacteria bacterium]
MSSLREQQKEKRRNNILMSAREHFRERGYDATSIENIAEAAEVSAVTVYNHYRTKGGVLLALVTESDALLIEKIEALIATPSGTPLEAVFAFSSTINKHAFSYLNREIWRHVIATSIIEGNSEFGRAYKALDANLIGLLFRFLENLKNNAILSTCCDCKAAADVLYNVHNARFLEYIIDRTRTESQRDILTQRDLAFVMKSLDFTDEA